MAENVTSHDSYSAVELQWRRQRAQEDSHQNEFYKKLDSFPSLLALRSELQNLGFEKLEVLLQKQKEELKECVLPYHLEEVRCHNLIIFFMLLLGHKQDALDYCETERLKIDTSKSINFLTLKAMLQWEFRRSQDAHATLKLLQDLYKLPDYKYLLAVAESEKGYLLICIGPSGLHHAMHLFQNAINTCAGSDIYLWKFDLALAIRRNFYVHAYLEHSKFPPSELAKQAITLFDDVMEKCPNEAYRSRAMLEQARLVSYLKTFCHVCDPNEKEHIEGLCEKYDANACFEKALSTDSGKKDYFILRECGRHFLYFGDSRDYSRAIDCLEKSYVIRKTDMVCQLFGKAYVMMYKAGVNYFSSWSGSGAADSPLSHNSGNKELATKPVSNDEPEEITVESDESEREQLLAEFDSTPFMDKDGIFLSTQPEGFGNILPVQHSPSRPFAGSSLDGSALTASSHSVAGEGQDPIDARPTGDVADCAVPKIVISTCKARKDEPEEITVESDESEREQLLAEFDSTPFMDKDGIFLSTQLEGFGNILPVQHSPSRDEPEEITVESDESEREQLLAEFDSTPFMDKDGIFLSTQPEGFGNILHVQHSPSRPFAGSSLDGSALTAPSHSVAGEGQDPIDARPTGDVADCAVPEIVISTCKARKEKLLAEYDHGIFIDEVGEYKTTQPEGTVGNMKVSRHVGSEREPMLKSLQSFPSPDDKRLQKNPKRPLLPSPDDSAFQQGSSIPRRTLLPYPGDVSPERFRSPRRVLLPTPVCTPGQRRGASSACSNRYSSPGDGCYKVSSQHQPRLPSTGDTFFNGTRRPSPGEMLPGWRDSSQHRRRDSSQHRNSFPQHGNSPYPGQVENSWRNSCPQDGPNRVNNPQRKNANRMKQVLKSKLEHLSFDAADPRIKTAEHFYKEGLELNRFNSSLMLNTGILYEHMEKLEKALEFYNKIVDIQLWSSRINLVNAYERIGICLMKLAETCEDEPKRSTLKDRAEDMFMSSLVECRRAVAHLPQVSANRAILWDSYPRLLEILQQTELDTEKLRKEAKIHEEVGEHLKAVDVYQKVMELAENDKDRTQALLGTVKNYFHMGNVKNARFILDLFLTLLEEKIWMLTAADDVAQNLRDIAVKIYRQSGADALENIPADFLKARNIPDTCSAAFRMALLMKGKLLDKDIKGAASSQPSRAQPHSSEKKFDLSIFYDDEGPEKLAEVAKSVASSSRQFFGMRVSVNNEEGSLGRLDFESELQLAESTPLVILLVDSEQELQDPEQELRPRMRFIATTALLDNNKVDLMLINIGRSTEPPSLLKHLRSFCEVDTLLALGDEDVSKSSILSLHQFLLGE